MAPIVALPPMAWTVYEGAAPRTYQMYGQGLPTEQTQAGKIHKKLEMLTWPFCLMGSFPLGWASGGRVSQVTKRRPLDGVTRVKKMMFPF